MIPSVIAEQVKIGVEDFIRATFPVTNPIFENIFEQFFQNKEMFKGPYISIKLPFKKGGGDKDYFPDAPCEFKPYMHQRMAFDRIGGNDTKSAIVATGTGSGKTECFMYPLLNHCYQNRHKDGIKAIIVYPMNALANNQAGRFAETIFQNSKLKSDVTVGLYVGGNADDASGGMVMSENKVITNRDSIRNNPPDILMTNYKMLDYMLTRPKDYKLWVHNDNETLKYLIVDELHSFDGAQGTDLACLIRRLKTRLNTPKDYLCCVGTSATIGSDNSTSELRKFAEQLFDEKFDEDSVILEHRKSTSEFFDKKFIKYSNIIPESDKAKLDATNYSDHTEYIKLQYRLWFDEDVENCEDRKWQIELGNKLYSHAFFQNLLKIFNDKTLSLEDLYNEIDNKLSHLNATDNNYKKLLIESMLSLIACARQDNGQPFLDIRYQLWLRELSRLVSSVEQDNPKLHFFDDLKPEDQKKHLPMVHCRECGAIGWATVKNEFDKTVDTDIKKFYNAFFSSNKNLHFIFPGEDALPKTQDQQVFQRFICSECLWLSDGGEVENCGFCGEVDKLIPVFVFNEVHPEGPNQIIKASRDCPYCNENNGLTIVGSRAASLTSVMITQLYASKYNDDKKLLTFSDSVQDASHRAGFFTARTYRFNFRSALQQFVTAQLANGEIPFNDIEHKFSDYWLKELDEVKFIATFLPPDLAWLKDYEYLKLNNELPKDSKLLDIVKKRIKWEIYSEFSFRSRTGRTLEKSGASIASVNLDLVDIVAKCAIEQIQNEIEVLRSVQEEDIQKFLYGIVMRFKTNGGVFINHLSQYINTFGGEWTLNKDKFLPSFGKKSRLPAFLTTNPKPQRFDKLLHGTRANKLTWHESWANKSFAKYDFRADVNAEKLYSIILNALSENKVIVERTPEDHSIWGLNENVISISNKVLHLKCDICGNKISIPEKDKTRFEEYNCINSNCKGHYIFDLNKASYYEKLYTQGDIVRINGAEHTGLLEREVREKLEADFIDSAYSWSPNLVSCTPTLEMGIDIGDLSSALLCSVPPGTANYLQRIGRAGRRDGNSFIATVANNKTHDLYFYTEPKDMLAGEIEPPGCFLNAGAVLERQLTAFCFDCWIKEGTVKDKDVPQFLKQALANIKKNNSSLFPYNLIEYIQSMKSQLSDKFIAMFAEMNDDAKEHLNNFIFGDDNSCQLSAKIITRLTEIQQDIDGIKDKVKGLTREIKKLENNPAKDQNYDNDLQDLNKEKSAYNAIIRKIQNKQTYNFFTDEGMLPNYAFPESGVLLRSVILKKEQDDKKFDSIVYEYERPSARAIKEFAPDNIFYAEGRKVKIDQIDLTTTETDEWWRFCNNCSYMKQEQPTDEISQTCPQCGSQQWNGISQKQQMIRLKQVIATTKDEKSRSADDSEDRELILFNKKINVDIDEKQIECAYKIDSKETPFGFEYITSACFREINFGRQDASGETIDIASEKVSKEGFVICKDCGKVMDKNGNNEKKHAFGCKYRSKENNAEFISCLYLYREFESEAIRILLPTLQMPGFEEKKQSFSSAILLGIKKRFGGNIGHLQTAFIEEPISSNITKEYLVVYDTVPGGTGYLKDLIYNGTDSLMDVFKYALDILKGCKCGLDEEKDGCYQCIYAYRNSFDIPQISRQIAMNVTESILAQKDNLVKINSVSQINVNPLFDSELEKRFIERLNSVISPIDKQRAKVKVAVVHGKPGWEFRINGYGYLIEPQKNLNKYDNVDIPSKPDFMIYPEKSKDRKPIAVFTDGFKYHADTSKEKSIVGVDMAKRMAIVKSGKYLVWSLTWDDIISENNQYSELLPNRAMNLIKLIEAYDNKFKLNIADISNINELSSFEQLILFLSNPTNISSWKYYAFIQWLQAMFGNLNERYSSESIQEVKDYYFNDSNETALNLKPISSEKYLLKTNVFNYDNKNLAISYTAYGEFEKIRKNDVDSISCYCKLFDNNIDDLHINEYKTHWNGFLRFYNIMQFMKNVYFTTEQGVIDDTYAQLNIEEQSEVDSSDEWSEVIDLVDEELIEFVSQLKSKNIKPPTVGYELTKQSGEVIASAELAWESPKVAILTEDEVEYKELFIKDNWTCFDAKTAIADIEKIIIKLK